MVIFETHSSLIYDHVKPWSGRDWSGPCIFGQIFLFISIQIFSTGKNGDRDVDDIVVLLTILW